MANKKLKVGGGELKLPAKKSKEDRKPKWQAKTGGKTIKEPVLETTEAVEEGVSSYHQSSLIHPCWRQLPGVGVDGPTMPE